MCGICGAVDFGGAGEASALVRRMTPTMWHRGPDDEGYLEDGPLALGMRRLSIIDLSPAGHQPIYYAADFTRLAITRSLTRSHFGNILLGTASAHHQ